MYFIKCHTDWSGLTGATLEAVLYFI